MILLYFYFRTNPWRFRLASSVPSRKSWNALRGNWVSTFYSELTCKFHFLIKDLDVLNIYRPHYHSIETKINDWLKFLNDSLRQYLFMKLKPILKNFYVTFVFYYHPLKTHNLYRNMLIIDKLFNMISFSYL